MMNQIKTILVMAVLAAVSYGVYVLIWEKPATTAEKPPASDTPPQTDQSGIEIPPPLLGPSVAAETPAAPDAPAATFAPIESPMTDGNTAGANPPALQPPPNVTAAGSPAVAAPPIALEIPAAEDRIQAPPELLAPSPVSLPPVEDQVAHDTLPEPPPETLFQDGFAAFMEEIQQELDEGRLSEVHLKLSALFENPNLTEPQLREITALLDQLAGTVIYSRQHFLEPPYVVQPGETLDQIAEKYNVPPLLIARINGLEGRQLEPGQELKMVRGPFHAVIHLERHELTLMVQGRYAGRFPIGVGVDYPKLEGEYAVHEKIPHPAYRGPDRVTIPPGNDRNPLGKFWIGLSDHIGLHGTNNAENIGGDNNQGTICLGNRDIDDLYGILSLRSRVVIRR